MALPSTDVDIVNMALGAYLGHTVRVGSLSDSSPEAKAASLFLDSDREICLEAHDWKWARKRVALTQVTGTGDWWNSVDDDWDYVYSLPADCVQPRYLYPGTRNPTPQEREPFERLRNAADDGYVIACDVAPVTTGDKAPILFYTARITTVTQYPQWWIRFLAAKLALDIAKPVLGDDKARAKEQELLGFVRMEFVNAVAADSHTRGADQEPPTPSLAARGVTWQPKVVR